MKGVECLVTLLISLEIKLIFCAAPEWDTPRVTSKTDSVLEDVPGGSNIYTLFARDDDGDTVTYLIVSQDPVSPAFIIGGTNGDELQLPLVSQDPVSPAFTISGTDLKLPADGVDAETETEFKLIFSASDGNGNDVTSVEFTVTITDVDDSTPTFTPPSYTGSLTDGAAVGTSVFTLTASGVDVSNSLTYAITLGNTPDTFEVDANGMVTVKDATNVDSTTTPRYELTFTATESVSGDEMTATGVVTVTAAASGGGNSGNSGGGGSATTTTVATDPSDEPNTVLSGGAIASIVVGSLVVAAGATAAVGWGVSKKTGIPKQSKIEPSNTNGETIEPGQAEIDNVNKCQM